MANNNLGLRALQNLIRNVGKQTSGTYNRQDPTAYTHSTMYVRMEVMVDDYIDIQVWVVDVHDCTWGDCITVAKMIEGPGLELLVENYWADGKWHWENKDKDGRVQEFIERIVTEGIFLTGEKQAQEVLASMQQEEEGR